jgi:YaaC-like Protein
MPLAEPRVGVSVGFHVYPSISDEGTLGDPETIIWASIHHLCSREVAETSLASTHGIKRKRDREAVAWNLKLYIKQASEFYDAARAAKPNTAPLIYYYSFLNLAKALCELRRPRLHQRNECYRHGLAWKPNPRSIVDPVRESVSVATRGVWHELWEATTSTPCTTPNPTRLRVRELLSYCPEVSAEFGRGFNDWIRLLDLKAPDVLFDQAAGESWLRFSVKRQELRGFRLSAPDLLDMMRTPRSGYREVRSGDRDLRTFESAVARRLGPDQDPLEGLTADIRGLNAFSHLGRGQRLQYFLPLQSQLPLRMPQLMVSYTLLFWLGSLVRYDPHSVSALMDSKYWMTIDGFMSQSRPWLLELFEWAFYQAETTLWMSW